MTDASCMTYKVFVSLK